MVHSVMMMFLLVSIHLTSLVLFLAICFFWVRRVYYARWIIFGLCFY